MELKFVSATKPTQVSPDVQRRQKMASQIDRQVGFANDLKDGKPARASWVWMDDKGKYFVPLKYGRQPLELKKGMFAVECKDLAEVLDTLGAFRGMVLSGEFDTHLAKASTDIRSRFQAKAK